MKNKKPPLVIWALCAGVTLLIATLILPPVHKPKARPSRIQTVNHVASVTMTMPRTNGLPAPTTK